MTYFRQVDAPRIGKEIYWHVEFYAEEGSVFPVGTAYVESPLAGAPRLNFILVADQWRTRGIASRLLAACVEKWPNLEFSEPISDYGQKAVERAVREQENFVPKTW
jgi:GNAT superfamily N-acetyltransferase